MKSKAVLGVLAVIGTFTLSATAAQAGSGGVPFPIQSFFVCHTINGDAPPGTVVNVVSSLFGTNPQNAKIGNPSIACVIAKLFPAAGGDEIAPQPLGSTNQEGLKCYTYQTQRKTSTPPGVADTYIVTDRLFGTDPDVQASHALQYICAPANFLLNLQ